MMSIRTLLVDDNTGFLDAAARFLALQPRIEIVGQACSGAEAIERVRHLQPDLVLMDWQMPHMSGVDATRHLKAQPGAPCIVILTQHEGGRYRAAAEAAGADGFVMKAEFGTALLPLIETLVLRLQQGTQTATKINLREEGLHAV
jgi:DNA-binding NarL/FixJ family response regulator